jgi:molecular chaperone GrpE
VGLVYRKFVDALKQLGVEPIEAEGQPFDEQEHEAVLQQPAPDGVAPGTVLSEVQRGYRLGERVIRHARVIVAM